MTKRIAKTIVPLKSTFSKPRLVWYAALKLSFPPNAPPTLDSDFCNSIEAIISIARMICKYGNNAVITKSSIAEKVKKSKTIAKHLFLLWYTENSVAFRVTIQ